MGYIEVFSLTFSLFFAIMVGFFARRKNLLTERSTLEFSIFVIRVLFPLFLFRSAITYMSKEYLLSAPIYPLLHMAICLIMLAVSGWITKAAKISPEREPILRFSSLVGNTGFLGLTFATVFFESEEVIAGILYDFGGSLMLFFVLIPVLLDRNNRHDPKRIFREPNIIAVISGLLLGLLGIRIPEFLVPSFTLISQVTLPLALIICGSQLGGMQFNREARYTQAFYVILIKMILMPILMVVLLQFLPLTDRVKQFLILMSAMPSGISMVNFSNTYHQDSDFAAFAVFSTTLFSMVWLPGLLLISEYIF